MLKLQVDPGGEWLIPFCKTQLRALKAWMKEAGITNFVKNLVFSSGERAQLYVYEYGIDRIRITAPTTSTVFIMLNPSLLDGDYPLGDFGLVTSSKFAGLPSSFAGGAVVDPYWLAQSPATYAEIADRLGTSNYQLDRFRYFQGRDGGTLVVASVSAGPYISWIVNCEANEGLLIYTESDVPVAGQSAASNMAIGSDASALCAFENHTGDVYTSVEARLYSSPTTTPPRTLPGPTTPITITFPAGGAGTPPLLDGVASMSVAVAMGGAVPFLACIYDMKNYFGNPVTSTLDVITMEIKSAVGTVVSEVLYSGGDESVAYSMRGLKVAENGADYIAVYAGPYDAGVKLWNIRTSAGVVVLDYADSDITSFRVQEPHMAISSEGVPAVCLVGYPLSWVVQVGEAPVFARAVTFGSPNELYGSIACAWTPDGRYLIAVRGGTVAIFSSAGALLFEGDPGPTWSPSFPTGFFVTGAGSETDGKWVGAYTYVSINPDGYVSDTRLSITQDPIGAATVTVTSSTKPNQIYTSPPLYLGAIDDIRRPYD